MNQRTAFLVLFIVASVFAAAQNPHSTNPEEARLISLEKMWNQAQMQHDSAALKGMISDRFVSTEWDGVLSTRDQFLSEISDPKFDPAVMSVEDVKVEFYDDTAIVIGVYRTKGKSNGKPYEHVGRFTDTWIRTNSVWKCVASHTSLIQK